VNPTALENELNDLLNFVSDQRDWDDMLVIFSRAYDFVEGLQRKCSLEVYSAPLKNTNKYGPLGEKIFFRNVWHSGKKARVKKEVIIKLLRKLNKGNSAIEGLNEGNSSYFVFSIGQRGKQGTFVILKDASFSDNAILVHFARFLKNAFNVNTRIDDLTTTKNLIHIDDVTGLYNQRKLYVDIDFSIDKFSKTNRTFSLLFLDIDHFKSVNDVFGHVTGTKLLTQLGGLLKSTMRDTDLIYRYGGDEFVLIIPGISSKKARKIAQRLLDSIKANQFSLENGDLFKMTVSIGVAEFPQDASSKSEIIEIADQMMYFAKSSGRGRVCHAGNFIKKGSR